MVDLGIAVQEAVRNVSLELCRKTEAGTFPRLP